jgi:2-keto-3-deoxy-L-rhamnonate aldolase RhmA
MLCRYARFRRRSDGARTLDGAGIIMKVLDAGAYGMICPMANNARQAAEFV